jgi:hypothetical protein
MFKTVVVGVVGAALAAGCQGPESFRARFDAGATSGVAGSFGAAGTGIVPIMVTGEAGTGSGPAGAGGTVSLTGAAGVGLPGGGGGAGGVGGTTGGGGAAGNGTSGTTTGGAGAAGVAGAAGAAGVAGTAGTGGAQVDAGAAGRPGTPDAGPRDTAPAAGPSVAYASTNWKPTASITAAGTADLPPNAFDGKLATRWTTGRNQLGDESFMVDLGQAEPVSRVVLDDTTHPQDFPVAYTVEVSTDGMTFMMVKTGKGATTTDIQFARVNARYIRIRQTGMTAAGGSWWSIDELRVYS